MSNDFKIDDRFLAHMSIRYLAYSYIPKQHTWTILHTRFLQLSTFKCHRTGRNRNRIFKELR